jgi:hypothetical protein
MEEQRSELVAKAILEDKLVDIWPEFPCTLARFQKQRSTRKGF